MQTSWHRAKILFKLRKNIFNNFMYQSNLEVAFFFYLDASSSVLNENATSTATDGELSAIIDESSLNVANN